MLFRRITLAAAAALALTSASFAADLGGTGYLGASHSTDYVNPNPSWTGFYVGANLGYGFGGHFDSTTTTTGPGFNATTDSGMDVGNALVYGGKAGIDWQFADRWVAELEVSLNLGGGKGSRTDTWCTPATCGFTGVTTTEATIKWFGMANAGVGYLLTPNWLVMVDGGFAFGRGQGTSTDNCPFCSFTNATTSALLGWDVGAKTSWRFARNWSADLSYNYLHLTAQDSTQDLGGGFSSSGHNGFNRHIVLGGVTYHF